MGLIAKIKSFTRRITNGVTVSEAKVDPGGGDILTTKNFSPAGDDAHPLPGDYNIIVATGQQGVFVSVGFIDPKNAPISAEGEKRSYARNAEGEVVVQFHMKNDGTYTLFNGAGAMALLPDGTFDLNGVTIAPNGAIVTPTSITSPSVVAGGLELVLHEHNILGGSSAPGPTGPNL